MANKIQVSTHLGPAEARLRDGEGSVTWDIDYPWTSQIEDGDEDEIREHMKTYIATYEKEAGVDTDYDDNTEDAQDDVEEETPEEGTDEDAGEEYYSTKYCGDEPAIAFKKGGKITALKLAKRYWRNAGRELQRLGYVDYPEGKGSKKAYKLLKDLPDAEYVRWEAKTKLYTNPIEEVIGNATGEVECLKDEMEEWQSSLESAEMEQVPKYEEVVECVDMIESYVIQALEDLDVPDSLKAVRVFVDSMGVKDPSSRSDRLGDVVRELEAVSEALRDLVTDIEADDEDALAFAKKHNITIDDLNTFADEVDSAQSETDNVYFPGMY